MDAILLLGHGSRLTEANKTLNHIAYMVKEMGNIPLVEVAFLQFGKPDFFEGIFTCISKGAKKVIIHPYFLCKGRHFQEDITEMIQEVEKKYSNIEFVLTEPLGVHENIAKVVLERAGKNIKEVKVLKPHEIEAKSFEIVTEELRQAQHGEINPCLSRRIGTGTSFRDIELPVVKRVIHATGDFDFAKNMRFHPDAVDAGVRAIRNGKDILVDVRMVEAGINKKLLQMWGGKIICKIQNKEQRTQNTENPPLPLPTGQAGPFSKGGVGGFDNTELASQTKTEIGIEVALKENNNIGIVTIGNAPTALYRAMKLIKDGVFKPELVIGVPVGFVRAIESKEVLLHMKYPFITSLGRKGGSTVAVAIMNALLKMAEEGL